MKIPKTLRMTEDGSGDRVFTVRELHSLFGGAFFLMFGLLWMTIVFLCAVDFCYQSFPPLKTVMVGALLAGGGLLGMFFFYFGCFCWFGAVRFRIGRGEFRWTSVVST